MIDHEFLDSIVYEMIEAIPLSAEAREAEDESYKLYNALDVKIRGEKPQNAELSKLMDACANELSIHRHDMFLSGLKVGLRLGFYAMGNGENSGKGGLNI